MQETDYLHENVKVLESIKQIKVFKPFSETELKHLLDMSKIRKYKAGEIIITEGDSDIWIYFLIYGKIKITKFDKDVVELSRRGDVFGEMSFIDNSVRSASATALSDAVCLSLDTTYIQKLSGNDKLSFGYVLYRLLAEIMAERLRATTQELAAAKGKRNLKFW